MFAQHRVPVALFVLVCLFSGARPATAQAADVRQVSIESDPPGARIFLLKGFKQQLIGVTPTEHAFSVQSDRSIIRLRIEKSGYRTRTVKLSGNDGHLAVDLEAIPLIDSTLPGTTLDARRDALLTAFAPWSIDGPAEVTLLDDRRLLSFSLVSGDRRPTTSDSEAIATKVASMLAGTRSSSSLDGILLTFRWRAAQGISTSVGTRMETELVCQGATVPTSVWDSCASRSATTSVTSTGTKTEYRCMGGMVTRSVWNNCARQVPRQKQVVDLKANVGTGMRDNAIVQVLEGSSTGFRHAGHCEYRNGRLISQSGDSSDVVKTACR